MNKNVELVTDALSIVAESPVWDQHNKLLYYVDIQGKRLRKLDWNNAKISDLVIPQQIGCIALDANGDIVGGLEDGVYRIDKNGSLKIINKPFNMEGIRFNDGKAGPDGMFYLGTMSREGKASLYRMDYEGGMHKLLGEIGNSNGLDWDTQRNLFYFNDTPTMKTDVFDFNMQNGNISNRRTAYKYQNMGSPDGMAIDIEGKLWTALWGGGRIVRVDPQTGSILETVIIPVENVASCVFAGEDLRDLIITASSHFTDLGRQPLAGSVFKIRTDVPGKQMYRLFQRRNY